MMFSPGDKMKAHVSERFKRLSKAQVRIAVALKPFRFKNRFEMQALPLKVPAESRRFADPPRI